jgi:hypothetical protein
MRLMCDIYEAAGVYWRISKSSIDQQLNKLRGVSLLGILQECVELGRMMPCWGGSLSPRKSVANPVVGFYAFRCI